MKNYRTIYENLRTSHITLEAMAFDNGVCDGTLESWNDLEVLVERDNGITPIPEKQHTNLSNWRCSCNRLIYRNDHFCGKCGVRLNWEKIK